MIIFSPHALLKLGHRGINKDLVIKTINRPDFTRVSYSDRIAVYKRFGKLFMKVVFRKEGKDLIIITQHWTDKLK